MDRYQNPEFIALARNCVQSPGDMAAEAAMEGWLLDHGESEFRASERLIPVFGQMLPGEYYGIGIGSGSGIGRGIGRGSGRGIGIGIGRGSGIGIGIGRGSGRGSGRGIGIGIGRGSGSGKGSGIGRGIGRGSGRGKGSGKGTIMEIGLAYLITTVDWFSWVGRVSRQTGPWEWEFESCSKISETNNGDCWEELAAGDKAARKRATYRHYKVPVILGMGAVAKILWVGKTPQEDGL